MTKTSSRLRANLLMASLLAASGAAQAQLAPIYNELVNTVQKQLTSQAMAQMGLGIEGAVSQSGAATQGEILKSAAAKKSVAEGVESYKQQESLRRQTQTQLEALQQPALTCSTMATQGGLGSANQSSRGKVGANQERVMKQVAGNTNTLAALDTSYKTTNASLCTPEEAARGICEVNPANKDLAGADQNVAFLFQGKDGSPTYVGGQDGAQAKAVDGYISRVIAGMPPEQLRAVEYGKSPQSRAYVELMRRFAAVVSMSAYSLNQIKELHNAITGLGNDTKMANVVGFPAKTDMSMMEVMQRFIAAKFSPESMKDAAKATNQNLILRDMAQTTAFQLWIDHQTLLQDSRTEALMAHQLALMTEQTLRPALDAQRLAATRAARQ